MFVVVTSILTVLAWLHLLVFAVYNIGALDGRDRIGFAVNLSAAILCLAIIGIAAYSAIRPRRAFVLIPLIASSLLALSLIRGLGSHVSIGFWWHQPVWHSLIDRTALAWLYGIFWFLPLPFLWSVIWLRLARPKET